MAESLLQNMGLGYVVSYGRETYLYNPEKKEMEAVQKKTQNNLKTKELKK